MSLELKSEAPPLRVESDGAIRIGDSRVLLELVIQAFNDGASPEQIVELYDTLSLADVYAVIGYYLHHPKAINAYLAESQNQWDATKADAARRNADLGDIRARLLSRRQGQTP